MALSFQCGMVTSGLFQGLVIPPPVPVDEKKAKADEKVQDDYIKNPDNYKSGDKDGQVPDNLQDTPNAVSADKTDDTPPSPDVPFDGTLCKFLEAALAEASQGKWTRQTNTTARPPVLSPSNANIMAAFEASGYKQPNDSVAWCMAFVVFALRSCNMNHCLTQRARDIRDKASLFKATPVTSDPQCGDIVLWQYGSGNHVNFVHKVSGQKFSCIGGNQGLGKSSAAVSNNPTASGVTESYGSVTASLNYPGVLGVWRPTPK